MPRPENLQYVPGGVPAGGLLDALFLRGFKLHGDYWRLDVPGDTTCWDDIVRPLYRKRPRTHRPLDELTVGEIEPSPKVDFRFLSITWPSLAQNATYPSPKLSRKLDSGHGGARKSSLSQTEMTIDRSRA